MLNNHDEKKEVNEIEIYTTLYKFFSTFIKQKKYSLLQFNKKIYCKLGFADNLLLTFCDQPQSYIVVFVTNNFCIYKILVPQWKHGIGHNDTLNSMES